MPPSIFILESDPRVRPVHLRWLTHRFAEAVRLSRGEVVAEMGIGVTPTGRGRGVPVLWSDTGVFISDAVEGELAEAKVSGWGRVAARIENAKRIAGTYSLLAVTGRCRSIRLNGAWGNSDARLTVDLEGWDGSDVFVSADDATGFIGLTERAAAVFRRFQGAMPSRGDICSVRGQG